MGRAGVRGPAAVVPVGAAGVEGVCAGARAGAGVDVVTRGATAASDGVGATRAPVPRTAAAMNAFKFFLILSNTFTIASGIPFRLVSDSVMNL